MNSIIKVDVFGADAGDPAGPRPGPHADSRNLMQGTRIRYSRTWAVYALEADSITESSTRGNIHIRLHVISIMSLMKALDRVCCKRSREAQTGTVCSQPKPHAGGSHPLRVLYRHVE